MLPTSERGEGAAPAGPAGATASAGEAAAPAAPGRGLRAWQALPLSAAGGLALAAAFPPAGIWPLAAVGPAVLVICLWQRSLRGSFLIALVFASRSSSRCCPGW